MRALKVLGVIVVFVLIARYFPVFYYSIQFNDFVKEEAQRNRVASELQKSLLRQADIFYLPVHPEDIAIKRDGDLLRVKVDYQVPVDFFVFKHMLSFHANGAGLALTDN